MSIPNHDTINIARFVEAARRGANPAASSGERVANKLAKNLHSIGDDMVVLDWDTLNGFSCLCQLASGPWRTDEQKSEVFRLIRKAAGK